MPTAQTNTPADAMQFLSLEKRAPTPEEANNFLGRLYEILLEKEASLKRGNIGEVSSDIIRFFRERNIPMNKENKLGYVTAFNEWCLKSVGEMLGSCGTDKPAMELTNEHELALRWAALIIGERAGRGFPNQKYPPEKAFVLTFYPAARGAERIAAQACPANEAKIEFFVELCNAAAFAEMVANEIVRKLGERYAPYTPKIEENLRGGEER